MTYHQTQMRDEVLEIPSATRRLIADGESDIATIAKAVRTRDPAFVATVARGSSDHVCTFLKYAIELELGLPVASIGPSVASIYGAQLKMAGGLCLAVSQSGQSPDIVAMSQAAREGGALSLAVTNDPSSPLAMGAEHDINIHAGKERSVAATKTFVTSAVAGLLLLAHWKEDEELRAAIYDLPGVLQQAVVMDWSELCQAMGASRSIYVLGRGPSWAIANEVALKFKETCQIHAESYSAAEVLHGPVSIVDSGFPVLCLAAADETHQSIVSVADQLDKKGASVFLTTNEACSGTSLPCVRTQHRLTDPIALVVSFYAMVEQLAFAQGINPDAPRHLRKVTETI